jgi:hypothetical protein
VEVQVKKAAFKQKVAAKEQETEAMLASMRRSVVCDGCDGTFTPQRLETHKGRALSLPGGRPRLNTTPELGGGS